jgi:hypothetical protein
MEERDKEDGIKPDIVDIELRLLRCVMRKLHLPRAGMLGRTPLGDGGLALF